MPFKMSSKLKAVKTSCTKIKNPCKYCLQQVTNRNGLQCQGACKKWAHFNCLNYTPGKISDIKAGIIKVTCPCPDCETTQPKEYLVKPPYTCSNQNCPANRGPKCVSEDCPLNPKKKPESTCGNKTCSKEPVSCPAVECPQSATQVQKRSHPRLQPARPPTPPRSGSKKSPQSNSPCRSPKVPKTCSPPAPPTPPKQKPCPPEKVKKPVCPEKPKKKEKPPKKKPVVSPSCSVLSSTSNCPKTKCSSSDSNLNRKTQASMVQAVQEMCNTVGKLSNQLKELMCKVTQN
ncbi:extensin-like [Spodoptera litura]|uniref:Extensin-like n=1 Tax=Spodoptera litura TaxID=69820 RepID=A0A9J7IWH4_SPOLT|nr:extensin-like [Spodoptera litura]